MLKRINLNLNSRLCRLSKVRASRIGDFGNFFNGFAKSPRLRVVPHFSSGIVERAKRERT